MQPRTPGRELGTLVAQTAASWCAQVALLIAVIGIGTAVSPDAQQDCDTCALGFLFGFVAAPIALNCLGLLLGLPFRLSDQRWDWLRRHGQYPLAVALVGAVLTVAGVATGAWQLMLVGFPIVALGMTNAFPPFDWAWTEEAQVQRKIERGRALRDNPPPASDA